jgi:hypothetical protein
MKCKTFKEFSTAMSPKLADLNFKATTKHQVLKRLYKLAKEAEQIELIRSQILKEVKKVGPRLRKYYWLAAAMKNARKEITKALALCDRLTPPSPSADLSTLLEDSLDMVDEAVRILEASRRYLLGFEVPDYMKKKVAKKGRAERDKLMGEFMRDWKQRGAPVYSGGLSLEEWFETVSGTFFHASPLNILEDAYSLRHFRTQGANHWLILQAESFLRQKTTAEQTLRLTIIKEFFVAAFGEYVEIGKIKAVVDRANRKKRPKP